MLKVYLGNLKKVIFENNNERQEYLFSSPGKQEEFLQLDTTLDEKLQRRKDFTCQWLHTQLLDYEAASSKNMKW